MLRSRGTRRPRRITSGVDHANEDERMCWICLTTEEEMPRTDWLHPCRCRGTNKWVHETCLSRWIDEKQLISPDMPVTCTQCRTEYIVVMPPLCRFDSLLEVVDKTYERMCPSAVMGMLAATIYFSAVTYGALTMLELVGYETGMQILQEDPTLLMIVLPALPTILLLGRIVSWDDSILSWVRRHNRHPVPPEQRDEQGEPLPGAPLDDNYFEEQERENPSVDVLQVGPLGTENIMRASCSFCTALSLPSFAVVIGKTLYARVESRMLAILLGGLTFVGLKGLASVYLRRCQYQRKRKRYVLDYTPQNIWRNARRSRTRSGPARR
ncbi:E3 ubiquitin-protein ligase MARCH5 [Scaptodrosophila lebanonensis]|uniref:E3 ubiquitin-protein ligase MARCHF5 n=1 Tax=Drosophila lebanonensis TaxID=7225 RepID=A0A6J2TQG5_DROLE|nr:E3 ubiquitin-protein ligase MARCH5 [Scaptodrosophila lebanonensis]